MFGNFRLENVREVQELQHPTYPIFVGGSGVPLVHSTRWVGWETAHQNGSPVTKWSALDGSSLSLATHAKTESGNIK